MKDRIMKRGRKVNTGIIVSWGKSSGIESLFLTQLDSQLKEKSSEKVKKTENSIAVRTIQGYY